MMGHVDSHKCHQNQMYKYNRIKQSLNHTNDKLNEIKHKRKSRVDFSSTLTAQDKESNPTREVP